MQVSQTVRSIAVAGSLLALAALGACQTPQQKVTQYEDSLSAAGFVVRPANTPDRQAMLSRLPANKFVQQVNGDTVTYIYADPLVCGCLYVGNQQAFNQYKLHQQQQNLADERQMTATMYDDPNWRWNAWGPYPGFQGPAVGW